MFHVNESLAVYLPLPVINIPEHIFSILTYLLFYGEFLDCVCICKATINNFYLNLLKHPYTKKLLDN